MNKFLTILYLPIIFLFANCSKKDDSSNSPSIGHIKLKMENVESTTSISGITYKLNGTIISPKKVDMIDHGFIIKTTISGTTNTQEEKVSLGKASKIGYVTANYQNFTITSLDISQVTFFITLESGETLRSDEATGGGNGVFNGSPSFTSLNPTLTATPTGIDLSMNIQLPVSQRYSLIEYGVEYSDSLVFNPIGFARNFENSNQYDFAVPTQNFASQTLNFALKDIYNSGNIVPGIMYGYKFYAICTDLQTFTQIYIGSNVIYHKIP